MLWVPQKGAILTQHNLGNTATVTSGTSVTTGATATTKGTAVELITSTAFDSYLMQVTVHSYGASAVTARLAVDILVGAATEEILIADFLAGFCGSLAGSSGPAVCTGFFPLYVPAGTRIAARGAGDRVSTAFRVGVQLWGGNGYPPFPVGQRCVTYGVSATPNGADVTPGASGTEGAWTQVSGSTLEDLIAIMPSAQPPTGDTTLTASTFNLDVGVGAATEEVVAGSGREQSFIWHMSTNELVGGPINPMPVWCDIPAGQRLATRISRSSAADTVATWNVAFHAVSA